MKKILIILLVCLPGFFSSELNAQNPETLWFNINTSLNSLDKAGWKYLKSVIKDKSNNRLNKTKNLLVYEIKKQKFIVEQMKVYNGDASLKNAVLRYYKVKTAYLEEDYESIMNVDSIVRQSLNFVDAWVLCRETAMRLLHKAEADLQNVLIVYPEKYNIRLQAEADMKIKHKLGLASQANTYYNNVNLIFLKAFLQHSFLFDAIKRSAVGEIMQNQNAVWRNSEIALARLNSLPDYKGDVVLKQTASNIIDTYREESGEDISVVIDFFIQQDNMNRLQKIMEAKNARESNEQDRLQFEEAKAAYERAAQNCLNTINKMGDRQNYMISLWENAGKVFFERHVF